MYQHKDPIVYRFICLRAYEDTGTMQCSKCGYWLPVGRFLNRHTRYCPGCGGKIMKEAKEENGGKEAIR